MDLLKNNALFLRSLEELKRKKALYLKNYKPTSWELLTPAERKEKALKGVQRDKELEIEYKIFFYALLRKHRAHKRPIYLLKQANKSK